MPRTHGRLYDKWTLPDWLDVPVERHGELSRISTLLKATLDNKVRRASKSKKKQYHFPNISLSRVQCRSLFMLVQFHISQALLNIESEVPISKAKMQMVSEESPLGFLCLC